MTITGTLLENVRGVSNATAVPATAPRTAAVKTSLRRIRIQFTATFCSRQTRKRKTGTSGGHNHEGLVTVRTTLVLLLAILTGTAVAGLAYAAGHSASEAAVTGIFALRGGTQFFHRLIT
ncbi:MAG TPA: hypothetical protein VMA72_16380 [Streptosporangiaceae bacterium]|nr:hypothetical protein [Streptosporangiaceae bacterium]